MKLNHAVVIGGSLGGMGAARALSRHFQRVTVIDRDELPVDEARPRRGVPQSMQVHGVQIRGRAELEREFPGFMESLLAQGAVDFDLSGDVARFTPWGWAPRFVSGIPMMMCTRPLLETTIRRLFRQQSDNVEWLEGTRVTGLTWQRDGDRVTVTGVKTDAPGREVIEADMVVDSSGRGTRADKWFKEMGFDAPQMDVVNSHSNYAARHFKAPAEAKHWSWKAMIVDAVTPDIPCAASLFTVENGQWLVTAMGMDGNYAPSNNEEWNQFVRNLRAPAIADAIAKAEPLTDVIQNRSMTNYKRDMVGYQAPVAGYMLFGDAIGAFNPTYGQGITLHAVSAGTLNGILQKFGHLGPDAVRAYYKAHRETLKEGWQFSAHFDFRWPSCEGKPPPGIKLMHWLGELTLKVSMQDPVLFKKLAPLSDFGANRLVLADPTVVARAWYQLARLTFFTPRLPGATEFAPFDAKALPAET